MIDASAERAFYWLAVGILTRPRGPVSVRDIRPAARGGFNELSEHARGSRAELVALRRQHGKKFSGRALRKLKGLRFDEKGGEHRGHIIVKKVKEDEEAITWRCLCGVEVSIAKPKEEVVDAPKALAEAPTS